MAATQARARRPIIHAVNAGPVQAAIHPVPIVQKSAPAPVDMPAVAVAAPPTMARTPRAVRTPRSTPQALMAAALEAENRGDAAMAVRIMRRVCLVAPRSGAAHNKLAVLLATKLRKFSEACDAAIKAVELEPDNTSYKSNMNMMKILANIDDNDPRTKGEGGHGLSRSLTRTTNDSLRSFFLASWSLILSVINAAIAPFSRSAREQSSAIIQRTSSPMQSGITLARTSIAPLPNSALTPAISTISKSTIGASARIPRKAAQASV